MLLNFDYFIYIYIDLMNEKISLENKLLKKKEDNGEEMILQMARVPKYN